MHSIHSFRIRSIKGEEIHLNSFKGKKILLVNVASECGFTPQYAQLQELYEAFKHALVIIAMPCNDFGGQEPGNHEDIQKFCSVNYGVTFPITEKISIKETHPHPIYEWLMSKELNGLLDSDVSWNFCKYLLDEEGQLLAFYPSSTYPASEEILNKLQ